MYIKEILEKDVRKDPQRYSIIYYGGNRSLKKIDIHSIDVMQNSVTINNDTTILIPHIHRIINKKLDSIIAEQSLSVIKSLKHIPQKASIVINEDDYIKFQREGKTKYMEKMEFLRKSHLFYDPESDDNNDSEISQPLKILLTLYEETLPVDNILNALYGNGRWNQHIKIDILGELSELVSLDLVKYVAYDETDREGSYYSLTREGAKWLIDQITEIFDESLPTLILIKKNGRMHRNIYFVRVASLTHRIDPLFFITAIAKENSRKVYIKYIQDIFDFKKSDLAKEITKENVKDKINDIVGKGLMTIENGVPIPTEKGKNLIKHTYYRIGNSTKKMEAYKIVRLDGDYIELTALGENMTNRYIELLKKETSESQVKILNLPKYDTAIETLKRQVKKTFITPQNFIVVIIVVTILLGIVSSVLGLQGISITMIILSILLGVIYLWINQKRKKVD
jgi:hypothetical protein